jgi:guanylate kinase
VKRSAVSATYLFLAPPSIEALEKRLRGRGTETEVRDSPLTLPQCAPHWGCGHQEKILKRLANAKGEIEHSKGDKKAFWDQVLINDDKDKCYAELTKFLLRVVLLTFLGPAEIDVPKVQEAPQAWGQSMLDMISPKAKAAAK